MTDSVGMIHRALTQRGKLSRTKLQVSVDDAEGRLEIPVVVMAGDADGPVVWIQASLHGDEPGGPRLVQTFLESVDPEQLRGSIIAVPVANPLAFTQRRRTTPTDGRDVNRLFPGVADGSCSERLANGLWMLGERADLLVDIHASSLEIHGIEHAIFLEGEGGAVATARSMAEAMAPRILWSSDQSWLGGAAFAQFTLSGRPAILFDRGNVFEPSELHRHVQALRNVLAVVGMLDRATKMHTESSQVVLHPVWLTAPITGMLQSRVSLGMVVAAGSSVGTVQDLYGKPLADIIAPSTGMVVAATLHAWIREGEGTFLIGRVDGPRMSSGAARDGATGKSG